MSSQPPAASAGPGRRVLVALSGGVDSAVAALLCRDQGLSVVGVFMRNGVSGTASRRSCCSLSDARDARAVASVLGLPFYVEDLARPFAELIEEFSRDYASGLTPNPCIVCNNRLKFGELLRLADELGAGSIATGHYARHEAGGLFRGADAARDQSYLLHGLLPEQLRRVRLPLAGLRKAEVRALAAAAGLPVADKPDSADICFVPGGDYRAVVRERLGHLGPGGDIVEASGRRLGSHDGIGGFTVGQRRGLGIATGQPVFVSAVHPDTGAVVVGPAEELLRDGCRVPSPNWLVERVPERALVQLRHHHVAEPASLTVAADGAVHVRFDRPSRAVTPGQFAVFYDGDRVLGGGRIAA